ncbi:c-type cytochrome [Castellaniella sp.]|uniref:c-type cytochrome n=1 Tax=Castellaniella sp. TaxID=1955812 RepID=UPI002AFEC52E|nr:c-type cytochrome [Castellaniella sp.]
MLKTLSIATLSLALLPALALASDAGTLKQGEKLYKTACIACHSTGAANAPKLGNKQAWAPILARGMDEIMTVATNGKGAMPARGGTKADDAALRAAVEYMVSRVQ